METREDPSLFPAKASDAAGPEKREHLGAASSLSEAALIISSFPTQFHSR